MTSATPALAIDGVGLSINGVRILDDISFTLAEGEVVGLIGPNGAGKTSLINVLTGITRPTSGRVMLHGDDVTRSKPHKRANKGLGRTFQTSNLFGGLSVIENIRLAQQADRPSLLTGFEVPRMQDESEQAAESLLGRVGLATMRTRLAGGLSHGDKRKLEIAMAVATGARVLLLDEPMAGVNIDDIDGLIELIRDVHQETGATILFVEHHMDVVMSLSDRVAVLHHGSLLAIDEPDRVMEDETVQTAYIGETL